MSSRFPLARAQAVLGTSTGYRRWTQITVSRGGVSRVLEPVGGSFTQDARRAGRWDGRLSFVGDDLIPTKPGDLLTPFGSTVSVEVGLELLDGTISSVPYGVYEISSSTARIAAGERVVDVGLIDISNQIDRYRFETPYTVPAGTTLSLMVRNVVFNRLGIDPGLTTIPIQLGAKRVFGLETGTGPWAEILDVLASFSVEAWYNRVGHIDAGSAILNPAGAYALDPLTSLVPDFDTLPANVVVARGETTDGTTPVQAVAIDSDPGSPTYAGTGPGTSPYGRNTLYFSSPLILTVAQAQQAAQTVLDGQLGAGATYTGVRPYDPTIDAGDIVTYGGSTYLVDSITLDLLGSTTFKARKI